MAIQYLTQITNLSDNNVYIRYSDVNWNWPKNMEGTQIFNQAEQWVTIPARSQFPVKDFIIPWADRDNQGLYVWNKHTKDDGTTTEYGIRVYQWAQSAQNDIQRIEYLSDKKAKTGEFLKDTAVGSAGWAPGINDSQWQLVIDKDGQVKIRLIGGTMFKDSPDIMKSAVELVGHVGYDVGELILVFVEMAVELLL